MGYACRSRKIAGVFLKEFRNFLDFPNSTSPPPPPPPTFFGGGPKLGEAILEVKMLILHRSVEKVTEKPVKSVVFVDMSKLAKTNN